MEYGYDLCWDETALLLLENPPRYRSIPINDYRIVYEFKSGTIFILLVYHVRQNPSKIKKSMP